MKILLTALCLLAAIATIASEERNCKPVQLRVDELAGTRWTTFNGTIVLEFLDDHLFYENNTNSHVSCAFSRVNHRGTYQVGNSNITFTSTESHAAVSTGTWTYVTYEIDRTNYISHHSRPRLKPGPNVLDQRTLDLLFYRKATNANNRIQTDVRSLRR